MTDSVSVTNSKNAFVIPLEMLKMMPYSEVDCSGVEDAERSRRDLPDNNLSDRIKRDPLKM
jgi:hypothetical protein